MRTPQPRHGLIAEDSDVSGRGQLRLGPVGASVYGLSMQIEVPSSLAGSVVSTQAQAFESIVTSNPYVEALLPRLVELDLPSW